MKINKGVVSVQAFHYDIESPTADEKSDLNITIEHPGFKDENGEPMNEDEGSILQVIIPFEIHQANAPFKVSGLIGQVVQPVGFHGEVQDLTAKDVQQLSRPSVEYIETMTYQVTSVALNRGISLNFNHDIKLTQNDAMNEANKTDEAEDK